LNSKAKEFRPKAQQDAPKQMVYQKKESEVVAEVA